jgi:osmotically inducible lipoprotein OsmB
MEKTMMRFAAMTAIAVLAMGLAGCGTSQSDRTLSGAGIGAGVGVVGAAVTGGSIGTGAVVGAVVGGVIGATTDSDDIDLGDPIWRKKCEERRRNGERVNCTRRK